MKIAFHFPSLASGGVEKMRILLAKEMLKRGISVDFVLCQARGEYKSMVPEGVRIVDLEAPRTLSSVLPLARYLKETSPDYLISSLGPQNVSAIAAKIFSGAKTKVFLTQHNSLSNQSKKESFQQKLIPLLYRYILPKADGVISVSSGIADDVSNVTGFERECIQVLYNPAKLDHSDDDIIEPDDVKGMRYIISIGRLIPQKGYDDLLRAFSKVCGKDSQINLVILGVGPLENELKELSRNLGVYGRVKFLGFKSNPGDYIRFSKLLIMASRYEGFGNVLVEGLSMGVPVVSTDCEHGPREILEDGKYGYLVPVGDIDAMSEAISKAMSTPSDSKFLKERAQYFLVEKVVDRYLEYIGAKG